MRINNKYFNSIIIKYGIFYVMISSIISVSLIMSIYVKWKVDIYKTYEENNDRVFQRLLLSLDQPLKLLNIRSILEIIGIHMDIDVIFVKVVNSEGILVMERGVVPSLSNLEKKTLFRKSYFENNNNLSGELEVYFSYDELRSEFSKLKVRLRNMGIILFGIMSMLTLVIFLVLAYRIKQLDNWVRNINFLTLEIKNELNKEVRKGDEIGRLYKEFKRLIHDLRLTRELERQSARFAAIGQSTAMLAHDVRKPFSIIKILMDRFDSFKNNPSGLKEAKVQVDKSIKHVEGMISDIMDFSREVKLETNPSSITNLLDFSIRLSAQTNKDSNIDLIYDLRHTFKPLVDDERISRVLSNIITNGIEAIRDIGKKEIGKIEIKTRERMGTSAPEHQRTSRKDHERVDKNFVVISISNDGPSINEEDIPKLFEPFFTKGKRKGTGLGLASCQKIINLHGGKISVRNCSNNTIRSHPRENGDTENKTLDSRFRGNDGVGLNNHTGVEFIIDLPASDIEDNIDTTYLPRNIKDIVFVEIKKDEAEIDKEIDILIKANKRLKILLLEDEALYRAVVRNTIKKNEYLDKIITLYETNNIDDALKVIEKEELTHSIVDIDLCDARNGFDFLSIIKSEYPEIKSLVHTNRCIEEDRMKAESLGAEGFVPKPLNIEHLVRFLKGERLFEEINSIKIKS